MATDMFYGATPELFRRAKELRATMTTSEKMVWEELKSNQLDGFRFKSQHPLSNFIADFYCHGARLVVEIDGEIHQQDEQRKYDQNRTYIMEEFGIRVLRFSNDEVFRNLNGVVEIIRRELILALVSPPTP